MADNESIKKKNNGGLLPKMEFLIIVVFFASFIIWAMAKCDSTKAAYEAKATKESPKSKIDEKTPEEAATKETTKATEKNIKSITREPIKSTTTLYVLLDGLKLRAGPHLDSTIVKVLPLHSEVQFLNETTNFKQKINLGDRIAYDPWVKVKVETGHEGWVYGAGVHYFKPKELDTIATSK